MRLIPAEKNFVSESFSSLRAYGPFRWLKQFYQNDVSNRYCELRDAGIFSASNIEMLLDDWYYRVGNDNYSYEWAKWPDSKCISEVLANDGWQLVEGEKYTS